jgi:nucleoside-diphosphate-sugar epimerase
LGSHLSGRLVEEGHEVIALDIDTSRKMSKGIKVIKGTVLDKISLWNHIKEHKPDAIIHLAAESIAKECDKNPAIAMETNVGGLINALNAARTFGVPYFTFISSSFVYGDFQYSPADENHTTIPKGIYGGTKLAGEILTKTFCKRYGIDYTIIRPSAVYGYGDRNNRVVQVLLERALQGKPLILEGAEQIIDFTYKEDTVEGIYLAVTKEYGRNDIFNITRGQGRSLGELAKIISGLIPNTEIIESKHDENRPKRGSLDIYKARNLLGYNPKWALEDGVKQYLADITLSKQPLNGKI